MIVRRVWVRGQVPGRLPLRYEQSRSKSTPDAGPPLCCTYPGWKPLLALAGRSGIVAGHSRSHGRVGEASPITTIPSRAGRARLLQLVGTGWWHTDCTYNLLQSGTAVAPKRCVPACSCERIHKQEQVNTSTILNFWGFSYVQSEAVTPGPTSSRRYRLFDYPVCGP